MVFLPPPHFFLMLVVKYKYNLFFLEKKKKSLFSPTNVLFFFFFFSLFANCQNEIVCKFLSLNSLTNFKNWKHLFFLKICIHYLYLDISHTLFTYLFGFFAHTFRLPQLFTHLITISNFRNVCFLWHCWNY